MSGPSGPSIRKGLVHVVYAYDIGLGVHLERCKQHVSDLTEMARIKHKGHAPTYFQFDPAPLAMTQEVAPLSVGARWTAGSVDLSVYDFGGVSVAYPIPFQGSFEELIELSCALSETSRFRDDSRQRVAHLLAVIESAVDRANIADMTEDYLIFQIEALEPSLPLERFLTEHAPLVARLLRSERDPMSDQEVSDAMSNRISFGLHDVALVDWNAALLVDREPEDVRTILEFANLQLLEMRFLDAALDRALDHAYEVIHARRGWRAFFPQHRSRPALAKIGRFEVDGAILFERVGNALKLIGDQYLARVYRAASQRFRLAEWNASILRKLQTIESIYRKAHDLSSTLRMEALEWIIIALIAIEIVFSLLGRA